MGMDEQRNERLVLGALMVVAVLGFGLHQGARLLDMGSGPYSAEPFAVAGVASGGLVCLYVAVLAYLGKIHSATPLFFAGVVCSLVRLVIAGMPSLVGAWGLVAQVLGGAGWVLIILCWMQVFSAYRPRCFLPLIVGGFLLLTLMVPLVSCFGPGWRYGAFVGTMLVSFILLAVALRYRDWVAKHMASSRPPRTSVAQLIHRMRRVIALTILFSAVCGFIVQLDIQLGLSNAHSPETSFVGMAIVAILLVWVLSIRVERIDFDMAFAFCAMALLGIIAARVMVPDAANVASSLVVMLLHLFFCLLWMAVTGDAYERQLPGFFLLGLAVGCAQLAIAVGRWTCMALAPTTETHAVQALAVVGLVLGMGASLNIVFLKASHSSDRGSGVGQGVVETGDAEALDLGEAAEDRTLRGMLENDAEAVVTNSLAEQWGLSKREKEIVVEFSTGRSARAIADLYLISEHTVKTHLKRAYAKLGIHSRQELLDLIEQVEAQLRRAGAIN